MSSNFSYNFCSAMLLITLLEPCPSSFSLRVNRVKAVYKATTVTKLMSLLTAIVLYFYSASHSISHSEALPATALMLCRGYHAEVACSDRQLRVKDLPKVLTWRLELDS